jgi:hypothetical protein
VTHYIYCKVEFITVKVHKVKIGHPFKEERRKARQAKANRTGTRRSKKQEALATASQLVETQLLTGIEVKLPLRSSQ